MHNVVKHGYIDKEGCHIFKVGNKNLFKLFNTKDYFVAKDILISKGRLL